MGLLVGMTEQFGVSKVGEECDNGCAVTDGRDWFAFTCCGGVCGCSDGSGFCLLGKTLDFDCRDVGRDANKVCL